MNVDRRNPYIPFQAGQIESFLKGREIRSVTMLASSGSNTTYRIVLREGGTFVLRLYAEGNAAREVFVMNLVRALVPVPEELYRGEGWSIFSFLPGCTLQDAPEYTFVAARTLASISKITFDRPGWIEADGSLTPFPFDGISGFITDMLERPDVRGWLGPQMADALHVLLETEQARLAELDSQACLVHGDFNPSNILIYNGNVSGVLDWEFCHSGSPYADVGNLIRNTSPVYHDQINRGLREGGMVLPEDWQFRAGLIDLTSHLEFLTSGRTTVFKHQCVTRIERFLSQYALA